MPARKPTRTKNIKSTVLIGCNGFIGKNLLKYLETSPRHKRIIAIDSVKPPITLKKTKFCKLDLTETLADAHLAEILKNENCDTLIHAAMPISPLKNEALAHEIIAIGSYYVFNACEAAGVRKAILVSPTDVYGAFPDNPNYLTESMPARGNLQSKILADKVDAEKQALKYQKRHPERIVTILRHATILGPTIENFKTRYFKRRVITTMLGFDPLVQFVHESDVIAAAVMLVEEDRAGIFNLAGDGVMPLSRAIEITGAYHVRLTQIGFKAMVQLMWYADLSPAPAAFADFLRYLCVVDNSKIKKAGFVPRYTGKEALMDFIGAQRIKRMELAENAL